MIGLFILGSMFIIGLTIYLWAMRPQRQTVKVNPPSNVRRFTQNGWR